MRTLSLALAMSVLVAVPMVRAQDGTVTGDPAKGAALLAEARKALGGEDKLRAVKTLQVKGSFKRTAGNNQIEGDLEILIEPPGRMKRTDDTSPPGGGPAILAIQALNGSEVWDENTGGRGLGFGGGGFGRGGFGGGPGGPGGAGVGGGGFRRDGIGGGGRGAQGDGAQPDGANAVAGRGNVDPEQFRQAQLRQRQAELSRLMLAWLLTTDGTANWIGTAQAPDGMADVLEIRGADGTPTRLFLDASSHLPLMMTWQGNAPQFGRRGGGGQRGGGRGAADAPGNGAAAAGAPPAGGDQGQAQPGRGGPRQQITLQMTMADYKTVNGIKLPHTITRGIAGQTNEEWSISGYKLNQNFKAGTFEQKK